MTAVSLTISEALDIALKSYYGGKLAEAEQICLKILSADPDSAATINLLAVVHTTLGRYDAALSCYDRALLLRPDFVQALSNRGAVLKAMKRYSEALESFDRALKLQPDYVEVLNNRAGALQELGRYAEALDMTVRLRCGEIIPRRSIIVASRCKRWDGAARRLKVTMPRSSCALTW